MAAPRSTLDAGLLVLRLAGLGLAVFHGWPKLAALVSGTSRFHEGLAGMGLPFPVAMSWAAGLGETLGGLLVALGFFTRAAAGVCAIAMAVAGFLRHHAHHYALAKIGLYQMTPDKEKAFGNPELALLYLCAFLALIFTGGGRFSLDRGRR